MITDLVISGPDKLCAPRSYWNLSPKEKDEICNGAGPRNFGWIIPDTIYFLSITVAANIHDYMYHIGEDIKDKELADRVFINNMIRLIQNHTDYDWLKKMRFRRAKIYYHAVSDFGGPAYWYGKDKVVYAYN